MSKQVTRTVDTMKNIFLIMWFSKKLCFLNHSDKIHEDRYKEKGKLLISHTQSAAEDSHLTKVKSQLTFC